MLPDDLRNYRAPRTFDAFQLLSPEVAGAILFGIVAALLLVDLLDRFGVAWR